MRNDENDRREPEQEVPRKSGIPAGSRQHVRSDTEQGRVARPGGATQHSGGSLSSQDEEVGSGPGRGAD